MPDFEFHVSGIEDGIIALLKHLYMKPDNVSGYLNEIHSYGGELEEKSVSEAIERLSPMFPVMFVAYGDGLDNEIPAKSAALGEPRIFRHDCSFMVVACTNNERGEEAQRRGAVGDVGIYEMISDIRSALSGVKFAWRPIGDSGAIVRTVPNQALPEGDLLLNLDPLKPVGVEFMARGEGLSVYAQHFQTYFKWIEPDRRAAGTPVEEVILTLDPLGGPSDPSGKPGVILE